MPVNQFRLSGLGPVHKQNIRFHRYYTTTNTTFENGDVSDILYFGSTGMDAEESYNCRPKGCFHYSKDRYIGVAQDIYGYQFAYRKEIFPHWKQKLPAAWRNWWEGFFGLSTEEEKNRYLHDSAPGNGCFADAPIRNLDDVELLCQKLGGIAVGTTLWNRIVSHFSLNYQDAEPAFDYYKFETQLEFPTGLRVYSAPAAIPGQDMLDVCDVRYIEDKALRLFYALWNPPNQYQLLCHVPDESDSDNAYFGMDKTGYHTLAHALVAYAKAKHVTYTLENEQVPANSYRFWDYYFHLDGRLLLWHPKITLCQSMARFYKQEQIPEEVLQLANDLHDEIKHDFLPAVTAVLSKELRHHIRHGNFCGLSAWMDELRSKLPHSDVKIKTMEESLNECKKLILGADTSRERQLNRLSDYFQSLGITADKEKLRNLTDKER